MAFVNWVEHYWTWLTTAVATLWAIYEKLDNLHSKRQLREIKSRSEAPYLVIGRFIAHVPGDPVRYFKNPSTNDSFLERVLAGEQFLMRMSLINQGQKVRRASINGKYPFVLHTLNGEINAGDATADIVYEYQHERRGQIETFKIEFESYTGLQLVHTYETRHGEPDLRRVDPK